MFERNSEFIFKIDGDGVSPSSVGVSQLLRLLTELQSTIAYSASNDESIDQDAYSISLVGVKPGSDTLTIATTAPMIDACMAITQAISTDDFSIIPAETKLGLHKLWKRAKKEDWTFQFQPLNNSIVFAEITPEHEICATGFAIGNTDVLAQCQRVGGNQPATAKVLLTTGERLTVTLKNQDQARQLGHLLYDLVVLKGKATWDSTKWQIMAFEVDEISSFQGRSATDAFDRLAVLAGKHWDDIDPDEFVHEIRSESVTW